MPDSAPTPYPTTAWMRPTAIELRVTDVPAGGELQLTLPVESSTIAGDDITVRGAISLDSMIGLVETARTYASGGQDPLELLAFAAAVTQAAQRKLTDLFHRTAPSAIPGSPFTILAQALDLLAWASETDPAEMRQKITEASVKITK